jgi:hypothetical protein
MHRHPSEWIHVQLVCLFLLGKAIAQLWTYTELVTRGANRGQYSGPVTPPSPSFSHKLGLGSFRPLRSSSPLSIWGGGWPSPHRPSHCRPSPQVEFPVASPTSHPLYPPLDLGRRLAISSPTQPLQAISGSWSSPSPPLLPIPSWSCSPSPLHPWPAAGLN